MNAHQTYFTKTEACGYLRCSLRYLDYARTNGELQAFRYGRKWIFTKEALDAFAQRRATASAQPAVG